MDKGLISETLLAGITSFKLWLAIYGLCLVIGDTIFFTYFPILILGTAVVFGILFKFRIPPADPSDVAGFFGQQFRPSLNGPVLSSASPMEDQPGLTVKSRLLLMKSPPQMTSTPSNVRSNGHKSGSGALVIIGHRAAGLDAPENSLSGIRLCKQRGCEAVEFDVSVTKDLVPVLFHDENLLRIAGIDREIKDMTWDELSRVDISILHPLGEKYRGERVPTLEEAINLCLSLGVKFIIDLKDDEEKVVNGIIEAFKRHQDQMYSMAVVSSFYIKAIFDIRRLDPKIIGCIAWRPGYYRYRTWNSNWENLEPRHRGIMQDWGSIIADAINEWGMRNLYWWFVGLSAMLFHKDAFTKEETYRWMNKGIRLYAWTVNSPLEKLHFVQNVQVGYLTDTLDGGEVNTVNSLQSTPFHNPSPISSYDRSNQHLNSSY